MLTFKKIFDIIYIENKKGDFDMADINAGTLYDFNKGIMENLTPLKPEELEKKEKLIKAYFMENIGQKYFMLLCKELNDYTLFSISSVMKCGFAISELDEALKNRGKILSIDKDEDTNAFEIWIKDDEGPHAWYLFKYGLGVIEC